MDFLNKKYRFEVEWVEEAMSESFDMMVQSANQRCCTIITASYQAYFWGEFYRQKPGLRIE